MSEPVHRFPLRRTRRLRPRARPRYRGPSFNRIIPNLMTMVGLCAGLTAMRFALDGRFEPAAAAIVLAGVIDGLDGRLARLLKGTSRFGAEFDSLSDFACFGVAPGLTIYEWSLQRAGGLGYAPCVLFAVCMALRLARFNAMSDDTHRPAYTSNFFTGVPAPCGAGLALFPLFLGLEAKSLGLENLAVVAHHPLFCGPVMIGVAALSVSSLPVWSFKNFKVPAEFVLPLFLGFGLFVALLLADPWAALAAAGIIYLGMLPFSVRSFHRLRREAEALRQDEDAAPGAVSQ
jgi:CDP-diacylglycerol--serine O-phosphatidyltransferase